MMLSLMVWLLSSRVFLAGVLTLPVSLLAHVSCERSCEPCFGVSPGNLIPFFNGGVCTALVPVASCYNNSTCQSARFLQISKHTMSIQFRQCILYPIGSTVASARFSRVFRLTVYSFMTG
jgi:hypothetical protein